MPPPDELPWAILLAGGEGTRLRGQVVAGEQVDRPKQFCRFGEEKTLLGSTIDRALRLTGASHVVPVVAVEHRRWWQPELECVEADSILAQPLNRGTAVAVLHALLHILQRDDQATIVVFPCDHGIADEHRMLNALRTAIHSVRADATELVLLGVHPEHPETQYGWILPGSTAEGAARPVRSFVEKPQDDVAVSLMEQGALWNTFMFAASARALLERYASTLPRLVQSYREVMSVGGRPEPELTALYHTLPVLDFGRDLLQASRDALHVVKVPPCGWTDLGTPARVEDWLARKPGNEARLSLAGMQW